MNTNYVEMVRALYRAHHLVSEHTDVSEDEYRWVASLLEEIDVATHEVLETHGLSFNLSLFSAADRSSVQGAWR